MSGLRRVLVEAFHERIHITLHHAGARAEHRPVRPVLKRPVHPSELCVELSVARTAADVFNTECMHACVEASPELAAVIGDEEAKAVVFGDFAQQPGEVIRCGLRLKTLAAMIFRENPSMITAISNRVHSTRSSVRSRCQT